VCVHGSEGSTDIIGNEAGLKLDLKYDGWCLPSSPPFGPDERRGVVECEIGYDDEISDGMPEILWRETISNNDIAKYIVL